MSGSVDRFADRVFFSEQKEALVADDMLDTARLVLGGLFLNACAHEDRLEVTVLGIDALCLCDALFVTSSSSRRRFIARQTLGLLRFICSDSSKERIGRSSSRCSRKMDSR